MPSLCVCTDVPWPPATLVLLWGLLPHSVARAMAYTEPVLTAFAAWSL